MNFKAGDKVVRVSAGDGVEDYTFIGGRIALGGVCCVESVGRQGFSGVGEVDGIRIVGKGLIWNRDGRHVMYPAFQFRLVSEVKLIMEAVRKNAVGKEVETTVSTPSAEGRGA